MLADVFQGHSYAGDTTSFSNILRNDVSMYNDTSLLVTFADRLTADGSIQRTNLVLFECLIGINMEKKMYTLADFPNIEGFFNNVWLS